jgi:hypothetical protein
MLELVESKKSGLFTILDSACQGNSPTEFFESEFFKKNQKNKLVKRAKGDRARNKKKGKKGKVFYFLLMFIFDCGVGRVFLMSSHKSLICFFPKHSIFVVVVVNLMNSFLILRKR